MNAIFLFSIFVLGIMGNRSSIQIINNVSDIVKVNVRTITQSLIPGPNDTWTINVNDTLCHYLSDAWKKLSDNTKFKAELHRLNASGKWVHMYEQEVEPHGKYTISETNVQQSN